MEGTTRGRTCIVGENEVLSAAIGGALTALGWSATCYPPTSAAGAATQQHLDHDLPSQIVLVANDHGRVPGVPAGIPVHRHRTVVVVCTRKAPGTVAASLAGDVTAVIAAEQPLRDLVRALDEALRSSPPPPHPAWRQRLVASLRLREQEVRRFASLTRREQHVLAAMIAGESAAEMAARNQLAVATVRSQIRGVLTKLGVTSQLAAVALAHRSCREPIITAQLNRFHQF